MTPSTKLVHSNCSRQCQKLAKTGVLCTLATGCELSGCTLTDFLPPEPVRPPDNPLHKASAFKACPWEVINPTNGPTRWNDLFSEKSPCTCGQHGPNGEPRDAYLDLITSRLTPSPVTPPPPLPVFHPTGADISKALQETASDRQARNQFTHEAIARVAASIPPPAPVAISPAKRINVRAKGQRGERQVIGLLQAVIDRIRAKYKAEPLVLQRNALQAHVGGCDLHGLDGFAVEVKHVEVESINQWWKQTVRQAEALKAVPVLFYRASHKPWRVKFRAYVQTPRDRDLIELDIETELAEFLEWFEEAYDEVMAEWVQTLS